MIIFLFIIIAAAIGYVAWRNPDFRTRLAAAFAAVATAAVAFWEQISAMWN